MDIEEQASASCQPSPKKQQDGFIKSFVCVVLGVLLVGFEVIFKCFRWLVACCVKGVRWVVGFYALRQQQEQEAARQQECNSRMEQTLERLEKQLAWMERNGRDEYLRLENHLLDALEKHERQHDVAFKALQTHLDWQNMALQEIEKALNTLSVEHMNLHKELVAHTSILATQQDKLKKQGKDIADLRSQQSELSDQQQALQTYLNKNMDLLVEAQRLLMVQSLLEQTSHAVDGLRKTK